MTRTRLPKAARCARKFGLGGRLRVKNSALPGGAFGAQARQEILLIKQIQLIRTGFLYAQDTRCSVESLLLSPRPRPFGQNIRFPKILLRASLDSLPETPQTQPSPSLLSAFRPPPISIAEAETTQADEHSLPPLLSPATSDVSISMSCRSPISRNSSSIRSRISPRRTHFLYFGAHTRWYSARVNRMAGPSRIHMDCLTTNPLFFSRKRPSRPLPTGEYLPALQGCLLPITLGVELVPFCPRPNLLQPFPQRLPAGRRI